MTKFLSNKFKNIGFFYSNAKDKEHRTIEDELVEALVKVGAIPQAHADDMSKVRKSITLLDFLYIFFMFDLDGISTSSTN